MLQGANRKADFKNEVVLGNKDYLNRNWASAGSHYFNAISEIDRQLQTSKDKALPPQIRNLYENVVFARIECLIELSHFADAQAELSKQPFMSEPQYATRKNFLQGRIFLGQKNYKGITDLFKNPVPDKKEFDRYYLDSLLLTASASIADKNHDTANTVLTMAKDYLTKHLLVEDAAYLQFQVYFYLALAAKSAPNVIVAHQYIEKCLGLFYDNCKTDKPSFDVKFAVAGLMLLCEVINSSDDLYTHDDILSMVDKIAELLPKIHTALNEDTRRNAVYALINGIKLNLTLNNGSAAHRQLNLLLSLEVQPPNKLNANIFIAAANYYFDRDFLNIELATKFTNLAKRYLPIPRDPFAQAELLILDLLKHLHENNIEDAKQSFCDLEKLIKDENDENKVKLQRLFQKHLPSLPQNYESKDVEFFTDLCALGLEGTSLAPNPEGDYPPCYTPQRSALAVQSTDSPVLTHPQVQNKRSSNKGNYF